MIDREELRWRLVLEGKEPEEIEELLDWYFDTGACAVLGFCEAFESIRAAAAEMADDIHTMLEEIATLAADDAPRKPKLPRPPRCTGPKNKAATRAQRPARAARSSCRKIHK